MAVKKRGLGRGLDALLSSGNPSEAQSGDELRDLPVTQLESGKHQPRRHFDTEALEALAASIKAQGVVQPIVVRPIGPSRYEIVAGERRWRAAKLAGMATVPAVIPRLDELSAMAVALVENIQRADLNVLEEAAALRRLIDECGLTHEQCAVAVGKSRVSVSNLLRLFDLPEEIQELVRESKLSFGHARALLGAEPENQVELARTVVEKGLSVRQTEALAAADPAPPKRPMPSPMLALENELGAKLGTKVQIRQTHGGKGRLTIGFRDLGDLDRILKSIG